MLVPPRAWGLSAVFLTGLAAALAGVGCGGGSATSTDTSAGKKPATAASTDPMYAVSDHAAFTSTAKQQGEWYWLKTEDAKARWEFSGLPAHSTDLVAQLRVLVPAKVATAHFYLSYGTKGGSGDETLARAEAKLPVEQTDHRSGQGLARYELVIPARSLPASATSLWIQAALADDSNTRPPIDAQIAFRKESVRFAPLVRPAKAVPPGSEGTTETETSGSETTTETTSRAPAPAGVPKPPPPPPDTGLTTTSGGGRRPVAGRRPSRSLHRLLPTPACSPSPSTATTSTAGTGCAMPPTSRVPPGHSPRQARGRTSPLASRCSRRAASTARAASTRAST